MGVQKERKSTFLTAFEQREKEARSLFAAHYWYRSCLWMSLSSESSVSNKIPRYLYWSTDFAYWPPNFKTGVAVLFALLALNVLQTVLLQLKIIPCDSAYAWHTSGILCNQRTHRMAPDKLENDAKCCLSKFDCRLFISKFFCESSLHLTCLFHSHSFQQV